MATAPLIQRLTDDKTRLAKALEALGWPSEPALEAQLVQLRGLLQQDTRGRDHHTRALVAAQAKLLAAIAAVRAADQAWQDAKNGTG